MRDAERLPGKTESWRPKKVFEARQCVPLVDKNHLVIRLIRIVADIIRTILQASKSNCSYKPGWNNAQFASRAIT